MELVDGMDGTIYGSYKDGADIYKDSTGYYTSQWDNKLGKSYKKYMPKKWKPSEEPIVRILRCTKKNKKGKWIGCKWTHPKGIHSTKKNKSRA